MEAGSAIHQATLKQPAEAGRTPITVKAGGSVIHQATLKRPAEAGKIPITVKAAGLAMQKAIPKRPAKVGENVQLLVVIAGNLRSKIFATIKEEENNFSSFYFARINSNTISYLQ
jgi:hypothetical protein